MKIIFFLFWLTPLWAADTSLFEDDRYPKRTDVEDHLSEQFGTKVTVTNYKRQWNGYRWVFMNSIHFRDMAIAFTLAGKQYEVTCEAANDTVEKSFTFRSCVSTSGEQLDSLPFAKKLRLWQDFSYLDKYFPSTDPKNAKIVYDSSKELLKFEDYSCKDGPIVEYSSKDSSVYKVQMEKSLLTLSKYEPSTAKTTGIAEVNLADESVKSLLPGSREKRFDAVWYFKRDAIRKGTITKREVEILNDLGYNFRFPQWKALYNVLSECCSGNVAFCPRGHTNGASPAAAQ